MIASDFFLEFCDQLYERWERVVLIVSLLLGLLEVVS